MTTKTTNKPKSVPLYVQVEGLLAKYKALTSCDLTILIIHSLKSDMPFEKMQKSIAVILSRLKAEGKVSKIGSKQWKWSENSYA